jgi:hypothetical protein
MKLYKWSDIKKRRFSKKKLKELDLKIKQKLFEMDREEHEKIIIDGRDREAFLDAILNPLAPNKALKTATAHYRKLKRKPRSRKK